MSPALAPQEEAMIHDYADRAAISLRIGREYAMVIELGSRSARYEIMTALAFDPHGGERLLVVLPDARAGFAFTTGAGYCSWDYVKEKMRLTQDFDAEVVGCLITRIREQLRIARTGGTHATLARNEIAGRADQG